MVYIQETSGKYEHNFTLPYTYFHIVERKTEIIIKIIDAHFFCIFI